MANQPLTKPDDPDLFLEFLLRSALTAPGAASSPTAGRILARLLVVGAIEGGDKLVTPYLVPFPGQDAVFEVRAYRPGNLEPTEVRSGLGAAAALRIALRAARDSDDGLEVLSQTDSGLERCVLVRDSTGDFEFRFPGGETLTGHPTECTAAWRAWDVTLADWRAWVADEHPTAVENTGGIPITPDWAMPSTRPEPADGERARVPKGEKDDEGDDRWQAQAVDALWEADLAAAVVGDALEGGPRPAPPVEGWWVPGPDESRPPDNSLPRDEPSASPPASEDRLGPVVPWGSADLQTVIRAIEDSVGKLNVKPDLTEVEALITRAMTGDRSLVEPLARRLSSRLGESMGRTDPRDFIDALLPLIPRPGEVAEAVTADVTALLSEVMLRRRSSEMSGGLDAQAIVAAIEHLQVQMDGFQDQLRRSTGILQSVDERMEMSDRRALASERIGSAIEQEMQRLALRIDEQVAALVGDAAGGSELSDGIARLTRKLRQSVAQLDRALVRLDEVVEHQALTPASPIRPPIRPGQGLPGQGPPGQGPPALGAPGPIPQPTPPPARAPAAAIAPFEAVTPVERRRRY